LNREIKGPTVDPKTGGRSKWGKGENPWVWPSNLLSEREPGDCSSHQDAYQKEGRKKGGGKLQLLAGMRSGVIKNSVDTGAFGKTTTTVRERTAAILHPFSFKERGKGGGGEFAYCAL